MSRLSKTVSKAGKGQVFSPKIGPISTLDMGRFGSLQNVDMKQRQTHLNTLSKVSTFEQLKISDFLRQRIQHKVFKSPQMPPTPVQKLAIKSLQRPTTNLQSFLIAAETGSGKTLAYLLPLLTELEKQPTLKGIKSIVLVPTIELANQLGAVLDKICPPNVKHFISAGKTNFTSKIQEKANKDGIDLLVTTPDKVLKLNLNSLEHTQVCVVDEADSLFNRSFSESTQKVLDSCLELDKAVFVTATIPKFFERYLRFKWPNTIRLVTPSIHRLPRHLDFKLVEAWRRPYNNKKELALQQILYAIYHDNTEPGHIKRVLVFVNKTKDVQPCVDMLNLAGYNAFKVDREANTLSSFEAAKPKRDQNDVMEVLVCTDLAARGVDFRGVRNVVLYDMPPTAADLLHRAGRTGRLGTKGRVVLIVNKQESSGWVRGLETIVKKGMALA